MGRINAVTPLLNGTNFSGVFTVSLSDEDALLFPEITANVDGSNNVQFETGDKHYKVQITLPDGTTQDCIYWGRTSATFAHALVMSGSGSVVTSKIPNSTIVL